VLERLPFLWAEKLSTRHAEGLPAHNVRCLWKTTAREWLRHAAGYDQASTYVSLDPAYSLAASERARETRSHLLLYTPYAWEAFTATYPHAPKRVLFQYHPHASAERRLLDEDAAQWPALGWEPGARRVDSSSTLHPRRRVEEAWRYADLVICASSFTQRTLVEAGARAEQCVVVPYGVDLPAQKDGAKESVDDFRVLFVGSGVQRKGLHHLIHAWSQAQLPAHARLTLVCRTMDPPLKAMASGIEGIEVRSEVAFEELLDLYRSSALFAMPSLVEGFGQVYLEALSQGCPVLGTPNTCLPDLGGENDGVFMTPYGDVEILTERLEHLATRLTSNRATREAATRTASACTWRQFRRRLCSALAERPVTS
jgi:glycosyltransferase involved in cell wall biosynthesis